MLTGSASPFSIPFILGKNVQFTSRQISSGHILSYVQRISYVDASVMPIHFLRVEKYWSACALCSYQIEMCVEIHQSVSHKCKDYLAELARHNYVTPKSYLELLGIFITLIEKKKQELKDAKERMKSGLDKVGSFRSWCLSLMLHEQNNSTLVLL